MKALQTAGFEIYRLKGDGFLAEDQLDLAKDLGV